MVKFVRYNTRNLIFFKKNKLKGSRISITENLVAKRMKKLQTAREEHGFKNAWTQDRRIMYSLGTLRYLKRKEKIALAFLIFYFYFPLVVCFWQ